MTRIRLSAHPLPGQALVGQARRARQAAAGRADAWQAADNRGDGARAKPDSASRPAQARAGAQ